jgi:heme exporter protein B
MTMGWRFEVGRACAVAWKDLTVEWRARANFNAVVALAVVMLLLFGFALGPETESLRVAAAGILWLTILFSGVMSFNRSYQVELENGALEALLLYPGSRKALFVGKLATNLVFVLLVEVLLVPLAAILYGLSLLQALPGLALVLLLGTFGFVVLGTFYAAMASRVQAREVLLPLLLFPMLVPLLVASVAATAAILAGDPMGDAGSWIRLLIIFDVIFGIAALFAFEHVIEE